MEKYGFVYIWFDKKRKMFYVGSHWGHENDGYKCSSKWMRDAYRYRPEDFRRKILKTNIEDRGELLTEEHRYLAMIPDEQLGKKFYNLTKHHPGHWSTDPNSNKTVGEKISASPLRRQRISEANTGRKLSEEHKEKIRSIRTGTKHKPESIEKIRQNSHSVRDYSDQEFKDKMSFAAKNRSAEHRAKISENNKRLIREGKIGMKGRKHSSETIQRMKAKQAKSYILIDPNGHEIVVVGLKQFCKDNELSHSHIYDPNGSKGWKLKDRA